MPRPPFEEGNPKPETRPLPCPECGSTKGYSRVGDYRVQCLNCNALVKNEEVDMQLPDQEK
jgi:transcription initiation factor TFIIIB Brf1 subunit/transcription initiation factor TFIIB